jgi:hypothetical protein
VITLRSFATIAETGKADEILLGLEAWVQTDVGAIIYACSTFNLIVRKLRRIHTNQPDICPVSGRKDVVPNRWAEPLDDIAKVFPYHKVITSQGPRSTCRSF